MERQAEALAEKGRTPLLFALDGTVIGMIAVADVIKEDSPKDVYKRQGKPQIVFYPVVTFNGAKTRSPNFLMAVFAAKGDGMVLIGTIGVLCFRHGRFILGMVKARPIAAPRRAGFLTQPVIVDLEFIVVFIIKAKVFHMIVLTVIVVPSRRIRRPRRKGAILFLQEGNPCFNPGMVVKTIGAVEIEIPARTIHVGAAVRIDFAYIAHEMCIRDRKRPFPSRQ